MKVTVVLPGPVAPAVSGDRLRTRDLVDGLREAGVEITLVSVAWSRDDTAASHPERTVQGRPFGAAWLPWRVGLAARQRSNPFALYRGSRLLRRLEDAVLADAPDVVDFQHSYAWFPTDRPNVCTFHNVESQLRAGLGASVRQLDTVRGLEIRAAERASAAVVFSDEDRLRLEALTPNASRIHVVPVGLRQPGPPKSEQREDMRTALFVGNMEYAPNREAADHLVRLWPRIRSETALERLVIAGRAAATAVSAGDGVEVISDAPDLCDVWVDADVGLVPLTTGGGVRLKIIEAFSMRLPVVSTAIGIEGLDVERGMQAVVVDAVDELPAGIASIRDVANRRELAERGFSRWRDAFSVSAMVEAMIRIYEEAAARE